MTQAEHPQTVEGRPDLFDVIEVFDDGTERVIAEGKTEPNAEAIVSMAVMRRGVDHSYFTTRRATR